MTAQEIVARYYEAWQTKRGDLGDVPLADDFEFTGPVASFDSADSYRAMAREAGQAVTSAELLDVNDGQIVRGELIYDAEELRRAMARAHSEAPAE